PAVSAFVTCTGPLKPPPAWPAANARIALPPMMNKDLASIPYFFKKTSSFAIQNGVALLLTEPYATISFARGCAARTCEYRHRIIDAAAKKYVEQSDFNFFPLTPDHSPSKALPVDQESLRSAVLFAALSMILIPSLFSM